MSGQDSFAILRHRLRAGDQDAATLVVERFTHRLLGLAAQRLDGLLRPRVEPADVVQSVFKSFFLRHRNGQLNLPGWDSLWNLLATMTLRKCCNWNEYAHAACRDVRREIPFPRAADGSVPNWEAVTREPAPPEAAQLAEAVEQLFGALEERERVILQLCLQGDTISEVSAQLGCSERKVYRVLKLVRDELERMSKDVA